MLIFITSFEILWFEEIVQENLRLLTLADNITWNRSKSLDNLFLNVLVSFVISRSVSV